jgi:hypothetical protein
MSIRFIDRSLPTEAMLRDIEVLWTIFLECDRAEHRALTPALVLLEGIVAALERFPIGRLAADLDLACDFFDAEVIPHIRTACECRRQLTVNGSVDTGPCYDCDGVRRLIPTLRALVDRSSHGGTEDTAAELRRVVRRLHVVTRLHFVDAVIGARVRSSRQSGEARDGGSLR